ncbi:MAG: ATP-binding protein [Micromonosporaceae bacterium]|nr:ATP-binding protein [Micromonosporaceae bacterium]
MNHTFQVDLRGIVDLLSHHLYASPRVYVRELLQNAVDAITARRADDPRAPATIRIEPADVTGNGALRISDSGVGLTAEQMHQLLATIGRSSKRDELGFARHDFLGQFGIGLLSCFLVADEIHVLSRAEGAPTVRWIGYCDGRYKVVEAADPRPSVGTTVTLVPRRGSESWLTTTTVRDLARTYGSILPFSVVVADEEIPTRAAPWTEGTAGSAARRAALLEYAKGMFGLGAARLRDSNFRVRG